MNRRVSLMSRAAFNQMERLQWWESRIGQAASHTNAVTVPTRPESAESFDSGVGEMVKASWREKLRFLAPRSPSFSRAAFNQQVLISHG